MKFILRSTIILALTFHCLSFAKSTVSSKVTQLVESHFDELMKNNPTVATFYGQPGRNDVLENNIGTAYKSANLALSKKYLELANRMDDTEINREAEQITLDMFKYSEQNTLDSARFPAELLPVNQMFSTPSLMVLWGSGKAHQPFNTVKDYENFLRRLDDFSDWVDQAITNMQIGMDNGVVLPKLIVERVLPQLAANIHEDASKSLFYTVVENMPESFSKIEKDYLTQRYTRAITDTVIPTFQRLHDFLSVEYLKKARDSIGWSDLPDGEAWYQHNIKLMTTTDYSPDYIHKLGLDEVKRIHAEMDALKPALGFTGSLQELFVYMKTEPKHLFKDEAEMLDAYRSIEARLKDNVTTQFKALPKSEFEIRAIEPYRAASTATHYQPAAPDGSRKGVFYLNTNVPTESPKWAAESLFLHEAIPGHHFQTSLQWESGDLPRFRRFGNYGAYVEGWGLYAESLGRDLGFYKDPAQFYGKLSHELMRAIRLVVDTGMHAKGWSREKAISYFRDNSSLSEDEIVREIDRYIAMPAQALSYTVGLLKIQELRKSAEQALGDAFDIREFHHQILADGAMPLAVLESKVDRWIKAHKRSH